MPAETVVGVLALQGAFVAHQQRLAELRVPTRQVRLPSDLDGCRALVMPGGESTTMSKLMVSSGLYDEIARRLDDGLAVLGTCAGMILLATEVLDGRPDQRCLGAIDVTVRRNGYGRQLDSFETELRLRGRDPDEAPFHGVFIRAPRVERIGPDVEVLAEHEGEPVLVRSGAVTVASFHPELTPDVRVHADFIESLTEHREVL
ncbi:MAG: pyridoxal 5'-phosphate synthase glutaminase subunit PdxT [Nocardiopsis sp. BM-2018]|nr:MAG: pyridoxal 5'-phosphate synthase glutaminase subunit PdxT [Nocardiopsis sp. BM-2018]